MTDAASLRPAPDDSPPPFSRQLPDSVTVAADGTLTLDPDITERPVARVVVTMPDYVADDLAHLLACLGRIAGTCGGLDGSGMHTDSLAAALYTAAASGGHRCPEGALHLDRISIDPAVMGGVPCITGTRIPTATIAGRYRDGRSPETILAEFPQLTATDLQAALDWPADDDAAAASVSPDGAS